MKGKLIQSVCLVGSVLFFVACNPQGRNTTKLQYMPDMADAPTVKAQESYIDPPEHAVPVNAVLYPATMEIAERDFRSPFPPSSKNIGMVLTEGKELFGTFCAVCHGLNGKGKGTLGSAYPIAVPDISRSDLATRKDGFFFMKISQGGAMMPSYGHAISVEERWKIIAHLRTLQK